MQIYAAWIGEGSDDVTVKYNTDFETDKLTSQDLIAWMGAVQAGMMSYETYYYNLQRSDVYPEGWTAEDEQAAIDKSEAAVIVDNGLTDDME